MKKDLETLHSRRRSRGLFDPDQPVERELRDFGCFRHLAEDAADEVTGEDRVYGGEQESLCGFETKSVQYVMVVGVRQF